MSFHSTAANARKFALPNLIIFQQHRRVKRVTTCIFINIVAIANMSDFKSIVFINIVRLTDFFSFAPTPHRELTPLFSARDFDLFRAKRR